MSAWKLVGAVLTPFLVMGMTALPKSHKRHRFVFPVRIVLEENVLEMQIIMFDSFAVQVGGVQR